MSEVTRIAHAFKAAILAHDAEQTERLADAYLRMELSLEDTIAALSEQIAALEDTGRSTRWAVQKLSAYQRFQLRLLAELDRYHAWVAGNVREEQLRLVGLGAEHAKALLNSKRPGAAASLTATEREHILAMVGYAGDGSPLAALLDKSGTLIREQVTRALVDAVARAQNPRVTARVVRNATGMALNRALAISRTEQMRVYREATATQYRASGVQWQQRIAARDPATCLACLSLDGEISTTEASVDDHVAGRCVSVPWFGAEQSEMAESAQGWFDRQSEDTKVAMMGPQRYDLYQSGRVSWGDLGHRVQSPTWGSSPQVVPVSQLAAAKRAVA